ncbi:MAG: YceD family protein [Chromatiaceae bacterium]|nr:YceD family protein [Chromatiaceae bacterium]MCF7994544.1 YceD family protein [Chromatiaceae bacterium]MCF8015675.1 YceD family protein [Chromatiaceae bacterium]
MSASFPDLLDPKKAVAQRAVFEGEFALRRLPRLSQLLWRAEGEVPVEAVADPSGGLVRYRFEFGSDPDGRATVIGAVEANLPLRCQRCFECYDLAVNTEVSLALATGLDEANALPPQYEPLMIEDRLMRPADLVEDELILAVPAIPRHPEGECEPPRVRAADASARVRQQTPAQVEEASRHPFESLAALKTTRDDPESQD